MIDSGSIEHLLGKRIRVVCDDGDVLAGKMSSLLNYSQVDEDEPEYVGVKDETFGGDILVPLDEVASVEEA